jgi:hypothetical protein
MTNWWLAEYLTPVSERTIQTNPRIEDLYLIPGTHLIVVVSESDIFCWDTDAIAGTCLGSITFPSPNSVTIGSNPFELPGQCFFGVGYDFEL